MDALHERTVIDGIEDSGVRAVVAPSGARRPLLGRGWFAAALATLGLSTGAWLSFVEMPLSFTVAEGPDGAIVQSVGIGSISWVGGVRPQMDAQWAEEGQLIEVAFGLGRVTAYPVHLPGNFPTEVMLGLALAVGAAVLAFAHLPGAPVAAGAGVALALGPALPSIGFPAAIPLVLISSATAAAAIRIPDRSRQRRFDLFSLLVLAAIVAAAIGLTIGPHPADWSPVWLAPLGVAVCLGVLGEMVAARTRFVLLPRTGQTRTARVLAAFVPLALRSRIEGGDEVRSRLAIDLHNSVLPRVQSTAKQMRDEGSPGAADQLEALAADLRGVMKQHETVILESSGVGPAIRVHMEGTGTYGLRVAFDIRDGGRLPAAVELAAYRIGQAAIDNALQHSGGNHVDVLVSSTPDRLELVVKDDGIGIGDNDEDRARREGRLGLAQMWLRAEAVRGSLDIRSHKGKGTEVRFTWTA